MAIFDELEKDFQQTAGVQPQQAARGPFTSSAMLEPSVEDMENEMAAMGYRRGHDSEGVLPMLYHTGAGVIGKTLEDIGGFMAYGGKPSYMTEKEWDKKAEEAGGLASVANAINTGIRDYGREISEAHQRNYTPYSAKWFANSLGYLIPSAVQLAAVKKTGMFDPSAGEKMVLEGAGNVIANAASKAPLLAKYSPQIGNVAAGLAENLSIGAKESVPEAFMEAEDAKNSYIEKAKMNNTYVPEQTEREAEEVSRKVLMDNVAFITSMDTLQNYLMDRITGGKGTAKQKMAKAFVANAPVGFTNEAGQGIIQREAAGEEWKLSDPDIGGAGLVGALAGSAPTGFRMAMDYAGNKYVERQQAKNIKNMGQGEGDIDTTTEAAMEAEEVPGADNIQNMAANMDENNGENPPTPPGAAGVLKEQAIPMPSFEETRNNNWVLNNDTVYVDNLQDVTKAGIGNIATAFKEMTGQPLIITSGTDGAGDLHMDGTYSHGTGYKIDVSGNGLEDPEIRHRFIAYCESQGIKVLDEYEHPSPNSTGGHLDLEFHGYNGNGQIGGTAAMAAEEPPQDVFAEFAVPEDAFSDNPAADELFPANQEQQQAATPVELTAQQDAQEAAMAAEQGYIAPTEQQDTQNVTAPASTALEDNLPPGIKNFNRPQLVELAKGVQAIKRRFEAGKMTLPEAIQARDNLLNKIASKRAETAQQMQNVPTVANNPSPAVRSQAIQQNAPAAMQMQQPVQNQAEAQNAVPVDRIQQAADRFNNDPEILKQAAMAAEQQIRKMQEAGVLTADQANAYKTELADSYRQIKERMAQNRQGRQQVTSGQGRQARLPMGPTEANARAVMKRAKEAGIKQQDIPKLTQITRAAAMGNQAAIDQFGRLRPEVRQAMQDILTGNLPVNDALRSRSETPALPSPVKTERAAEPKQAEQETQPAKAEPVAEVTAPEKQEKAVNEPPTEQKTKAAQPEKDQAPAAKKKIEDFGQKIGGARKDMYVKGEKSNTAAKPKAEKKADDGLKDRPWLRDYDIKQNENGKWTVTDKKQEEIRKRNSFMFAWYGSKKGVEKLLYDTQEAAQKAATLDALTQKHNVFSGQKQGEYVISRRIGGRDGHWFQLKDGFSSREDAMAYMLGHPEEILNMRTSYGEADLPTPVIHGWNDARSEKAPERLKKGQNATEEMFTKTFGFRGVQFGNWNNQTERQSLMNAAYEGLLDLADVLGVDPKIVSLNGELGLAFGARGKGLTGARAHYEPAFTVINLTKMKGAGTLAHEWLHALDHYLMLKSGTINNARTEDGRLTDPNFADLASEVDSWRFKSANLDPDLLAAFKKLKDTAFYKEVVEVADEAKAQQWVQRTGDILDEELNKMRNYISHERKYSSKKAPATAEQLKRFDELATKIAAADEPLNVNHKFHTWTTPALEKLSDLYKEITGRALLKKEPDRAFSQLVALINDLQKRRKTLEEAQSKTGKTNRIPTEYYRNAKNIDSGRTIQYWSRPTEMLARAFSSFVEDSVKEKGYSSDFLSFGSDNKQVIFGNPFPAGKEREAINNAFKNFIAEVQKEVARNKQETGEVKFSIRAAAEEAQKAYNDTSTDTVMDEQENLVQRAVDDLVNEVKEAFPGAKDVTLDGTDITFTMPNGLQMRVKIKEQILIPEAEARKARAEHGLEEGSKITVEGYSRKLDKGSVIALSQESSKGTAFHEALHTAMDWVLNAREKQALKDYYGPKAKEQGKSLDEVLADAYKEWLQARKQKRGTIFGKLWQKIKDFARKVQTILTGTENVHNVFQQIESGKVWTRQEAPTGSVKQTAVPVFSAKERIPKETFDQADNYIHEALTNSQKSDTMPLWKISKDDAYKIKNAAGIKVDLTGYTHVLVADDLRHSVNHHGKDQLPIDEPEIKEAVRILAAPDAIEPGNLSNRGLPSIRFIKQKNDGTLAVVENIVMGDKELRVKTIWKDPSAGDNAAKSNPVHTSATSGSLNSSNNTLSQSGEGSKGKLHYAIGEKLNNALSQEYSKATDKQYMDAVNAYQNAKDETAQKVAYEKLKHMVQIAADEAGFKDAIPEHSDSYHIRTKAAPKKTKKAYKIFYVNPATGAPTALFVGGAEALPVGVWLDANDQWHFTATNGNEYVPSTKNPNRTSLEGKKKNTTTGATVGIPNDPEVRKYLKDHGFIAKEDAKNVIGLAYRPGWHSGTLPFFPQGGKKREGSNYPNIHEHNQIVFEVEVPADKDWTEFAQSQEKAKTKNGTVNMRKADLQRLPTDGYYAYTTNPILDPKEGAWIISDSMKIVRALTQEEADRILAENGKLPQEWEQGELILSDYNLDDKAHSDAARKTLAPITYDDEGNVIPLSQRFNREVNDVRYSIREKVEAAAKHKKVNYGNETTAFGRATQVISNKTEKSMFQKGLDAVKNLYFQLVDEDTHAHKVDQAAEAKIGKKLSADESFYNQVRETGSISKGHAEALIAGTKAHMETVQSRIRNKYLKEQFDPEATLINMMDIIDQAKMNEKHGDFLAKHNLKDWQQALDTYLAAHRLKEMATLAAKDGKRYDLPGKLTMADLDAAIKAAPPELEEAAKVYYAFNKNLSILLADAGLLKPELYRTLNNKYKRYCPLMRDFSDTAAADAFIGSLGRGGDSVVNVSNPLKEILDEGSKRNLLSPLESTIKAAAIYCDRAERNKVGQAAIRMAAKYKLDDLIWRVEDKKAAADPKNCIFTVMINGQKVPFQCTQELYEPIVGAPEEVADMLFSLASIPAQTLRYGATISPTFAIRNMIRDTVFAGIASKNGFIPIYDTVRGYLALRNNPELKAKFEAMGVSMQTFYGSEMNAKTKLKDLQVKEIDTLWEFAKEMLKKPKEGLEWFSERSEQSTRMGEFMRAIEKGKSLEEAARDARNLTIDFSRHGRTGKKINQLIPFFNACIQGGDLMVRLMKQDPVGTLTKLAWYIAIPSMALWAMNHDDDWWKELDPDLKNSSWFIKTPKGIVRIPKPQEAGILFGSGMEALLEQATKRDPEAMKNWARAFLGAIAPNYLATVIGPLLENAANYSFFRNKPIVGRANERKPGEQQYTNGTSELSKMLGASPVAHFYNKGGYSPSKIDNLIRGYTGTMGMLLWQGAGEAANKARGIENQSPAKAWNEMPFAREFFVNDYSLNRSLNDFYDLVADAEAHHNAHGKKGSPSPAVSFVRKARADIAKERKAIQEITASKRISPERKRDLIATRQNKIRLIAQGTLKKYQGKF